MNTSTEFQADRNSRQSVGADWGSPWPIAAAAAAGWLGVGILGVWDVATDTSGEGPPYVLFSIALMLSAALTIVAAWSCSRQTRSGALRISGLGIGAIAVASTLVAWAGPLWMTMIAFSLAVLALAAPPDIRAGLAGTAVGQVAGIVVTIGAMEAEFGRQDSYGDYPAGSALGVVVAAAASVFGMALLARAARASELSR